MVENAGGERHRLGIDAPANTPMPRWLDDRLLFVRVVWGRATFSDVVIDAQRLALVDHSVAIDGRNAWEQARAACGGACFCQHGQRIAVDVAARPTVALPRPPARPAATALIGIVELPTVIGPPETGGVVAASPATAVGLHAEPGGTPFARVVRLEAFALREFGYEAAGVEVHARQPGWWQIGLRKPLPEKAWLRVDEAGVFHPLDALLRERQTYLDANWNGHLWTDAAAGARRTAVASPLREAEASDAADQIAVRVLDTRKLDEGLWLKVETLAESPCKIPEPAVVDRGWIPAYSDTGALVAGWHSRGC